MHVPSAILHAIGWFCHCVVRLAQSIQQLSAKSARAASPLSLREKNKIKHENRLIYKLLKIFCCCFLSSLENPQSHGCRGLCIFPACFTAAKAPTGPAHARKHTRTQTQHTHKRTDRRTVGQGICHRWQSHSSFQSHPNFKRYGGGRM